MCADARRLVAAQALRATGYGCTAVLLGALLSARGVSSERAGLVLAALEKRPDISATLNASFERMLTRYREVQREMPQLAPRPKKRDFRRRRRA